MGSTADRLLGEVERIAPRVRAQAARAESERVLADEVYDAMVDAGLFRTLAPKALRYADVGKMLFGMPPDFFTLEL